MDVIPRQRLKIERTRDAKAICAISRHPRVFPWISDDFSVPPSAWAPPMAEEAIWLLALAPKQPVGWGAFFPRNGILLEAHYAFLPEAWGAQARDAFRDMIDWVRSNTRYRRLIGEIPRSNRLSIKFAGRAGFRPYGVNAKSILRAGRVEDQICMGLNL